MFLEELQSTSSADKVDYVLINKSNVDYKITVADLQQGLSNEGVSTVADLVARVGKLGEYVYTLGYHAAYDGGHGLYKITNVANLNGVVDDTIHHNCAGGCVAELVTNGMINPRQAGARATGGIDDAGAFNAIRDQYGDPTIYGSSITVVPALKTDYYRLHTLVLLSSPLKLLGLKFKRDLASLGTMFQVNSRGVRVTDCEFDNNNLRATADSATCNILIIDVNVGDVVIRNNYFHSFAGAKAVNRGDDAIIISKYGYGDVIQPENDPPTKEPIIIDSNTIIRPFRNGIAMVAGESVQITNNYIVGSIQGGILLESGVTGTPTGVEPDAWGGNFYIQHVLIQGNTLVDCGVSTPVLDGAPYNNSFGQYGIGVIPLKVEYLGERRYEDVSIIDNRVIVDAANLQDTTDGRHICYLLNASSMTNARIVGNRFIVRRKTPSSQDTRVYLGTEASNVRGHNYTVKDNEIEVGSFVPFNCERSLFTGNSVVNCDRILIGDNLYSSFTNNNFIDNVGELAMSLRDGEFANNYIRTTSARAFAGILYSETDAAVNVNCQIKGNTITGAFDFGIRGGAPDPADPSVIVNNLTVSNNTISGAVWGVHLTRFDSSIVANNIIRDCGTNEFSVDHDRGDQGGAVYTNFSRGIQVLGNVVVNSGGTPIFIRKCDPSYRVEGNSLTGSTARPYTKDLVDVRYTAPIYIYRDGSASQISWCCNNYYDMGSDTSLIVKVEDTPDTDGVTPDGSFYTGMFAAQGTLYNNSQIAESGQTDKPRFHLLSTNEAAANGASTGAIDVDINGTVYSLLHL